jgi:hypothetical protein
MAIDSICGMAVVERPDAAMSLSSVSVVTNRLRLRAIKIGRRIG